LWDEVPIKVHQSGCAGGGGMPGWVAGAAAAFSKGGG